jgi:ParB/RepB/Spo0J family partition protein
MTTIPIRDIKIGRRQRRHLEVEEIETLAASIKRWGLLHPVTLRKEDNGLVAGFRRIQAHLALGREEIPFRYQENLGEIEMKELELEENLRRVNLSWQEEQQAIAEIHALRKSQDEEWTLGKTAEFVGKSVGAVHLAVDVTEAAEEDPSVWEASGPRSARDKATRKRKLEKRMIEAEARKASGPQAEILTGDARELIAQQEDESFDAVITNFPFGVDLTFRDGDRPYEDDETEITDLVMDMVPEIYRVLRPNSWAVMFFDIRKMVYNRFQSNIYKTVAEQYVGRDLVRAMGLKFWCEQAGFSWLSMIPAIWVKPNKTQGMIGNPDRGLVVAYEAFLFAAKGDPTLNIHGRQNIFIYDTLSPGERDFSVEMPADLCEHLVEMTCFGGSRILDPFAGSGAIGVGALHRECSFLGFELNPERARLGNTKLKEAL